MFVRLYEYKFNSFDMTNTNGKSKQFGITFMIPTLCNILEGGVGSKVHNGRRIHGPISLFTNQLIAQLIPFLITFQAAFTKCVPVIRKQQTRFSIFRKLNMLFYFARRIHSVLHLMPSRDLYHFWMSSMQHICWRDKVSNTRMIAQLC